MNHQTVDQSVALRSEGQRLIAMRWSRFSRWRKTHPRGTNWLLLVLNLVLTAFLLMISAIPQESPAAWYVAILCVSNLAFGISIFWRKKIPLTLLVVSTFTEFLYGLTVNLHSSYILTGFTSMIFLYTLAAESSLPKTVAGYCISVVAYVLGNILFFYTDTSLEVSSTSVDESPVATVITLGFMVALGLAFNLVIVMMGRFAHKNNEFDRQVIERFEQTQVLAASEERNRIAREMHDVVAHSLTVMITLADGARIVGQRDRARAEEVLLELSNTGRSALADMRRTLGVLRNPDGQELNLLPAEGRSADARENLEELVSSFAATGLPVTFDYEGEELPADNNLRLSVYRIVQESLTNALRYAKDASLVRVSVRVHLPHIEVSIIDNGSTAPEGIPTPSNNLGSGKGLAGIRERAAFYEGSVDAGRNDLGGWTTRVHLVWQPTVLSARFPHTE